MVRLILGLVALFIAIMLVLAVVHVIVYYAFSVSYTHLTLPTTERV